MATSKITQNAGKVNISSRLTCNYGTLIAYEVFHVNLCIVAITFSCTTRIPANTSFISGCKASTVNRAPVIAMYNTDDGKVYYATMSSSGDITSHAGELPTGSYRMNFAYITD